MTIQGGTATLATTMGETTDQQYLDAVALLPDRSELVDIAYEGDIERMVFEFEPTL